MESRPEPETLKYVCNADIKKLHGKATDPLLRLALAEILCLRDENSSLVLQVARLNRMLP